MQFNDVMREAAANAGLSLRSIGTAAGRGPNYVPAILSRGTDPSTGVAAALLKPCGYTLCAVPDPDVPACALPIDPPEASR